MALLSSNQTVMFAAEARQADAVCRDTVAVSCDASTVKGDSVCVQDIAHGLVGNLASHNVARAC